MNTAHATQFNIEALQPVMICGSRDLPAELHTVIGQLVAAIADAGGRVVVGDNPHGADQMAINACWHRGVSCMVVGLTDHPRATVPMTRTTIGYRRHRLANHTGRYGAGDWHMRDRYMVDCSERVFAFWNGDSRGTSRVVDYARKTGKPVTLFRVEDGNVKIVNFAAPVNP